MNNREKWNIMISEMATSALSSEKTEMTAKAVRVLVRGGHSRPKRFPNPDNKQEVDKKELEGVIRDAVNNSLVAKNKRRAGKLATYILHEQDVKVGLSKTNCHYLWFC